MRVYLIGFMGAGKTRLGQQLAQRLCMDFLDLDVLIEKQVEKNVSEIFAEKGEPGFREIEAACLRQTANIRHVVISTGGGTPCFFGNMEWINRNGLSVYLKLPVSVLYERLATHGASRPLLKAYTGEALKNYIGIKLAERAIYYEQAHLCSEPGKEELDQINEMANFLQRFLPAK